MEDKHIIDILLVEDNPDDVMITKRALKEAGIVNKLWIVRDGQEAVDFLRREGEYVSMKEHMLPGLVLLDINLPRINGLDVLQIIKEDKDLCCIPVVMLTMSKREQDVACGYQRGCNSFIQKPVEFDKFIDVVRQIGLYWGVINEPLAGGGAA